MVNPNSLFIKVTDLISALIYSLGFVKYCRLFSDLRLIFYHGIGNNDSPCLRYLNDEVPVENFEYHLEYLLENYTILSLSDALDSITKKPIPTTSPVCSISFDDGLSSVYDKAFPILKNKNIPATVFLNTSVIGNTGMTWLHLINYLLSEFGVNKISSLFNLYKSKYLTPAPADEISIQDWYKQYYEINHEKELLKKVLEHLNLSSAEIAEEQRIYLNWDEIYEMEEYDFTFCSHTQNHTPLARFADKYNLEKEIKGAYETLRQQGKNLDFISFPFGMKEDYGEKAIECAFNAGHKYIFEVGSGTNDLNRVKKFRLLARVCLGDVGKKRSLLFSAVELRPKLKTFIKGYI